MTTTVTIVLEDEVRPYVWMFETEDLAAAFAHGASSAHGVMDVEVHTEPVYDPSMFQDALARLRNLTASTSVRR